MQFEALAAPSQADRDAAQAGVLTTMQTYLKQAILGPLQSGAPAGDVAALFSPNAIARATSAPDRSALFDEGLPAITDLRAEDATMNLTGLVGADAKVVVMTATFSLKINGSTSGTPVAVQRSGDLVLVPDGGLWKIDAYDIRATRDTPAGTTTTAAAKK